MLPMGAARSWATTQWRRQWPALVLVWLVLAITGALALGAATGARRAVSAFDRLRDHSRAAELSVNDVDVEALGEGTTPEEAVMRLLSLIDAAGATWQAQFFIFPVGHQLIPLYDFYPIVQRQLLDIPANVPVVVSGRFPRATEPDEVALSQQMANLFGVGVGDSVAFESASTEWLLRSFETATPGPKDGPNLLLEVTGIVASPLDFAAPSGTIYLTDAFSETYGGQIGNFPTAEIFLNDEALAADVLRTGELNTGDDALDAAVSIQPSRWGDQQQVSDGLRVVAAALWIFAGAAAIAGMATGTLIIRRLMRSVSTDVAALSALGVTRWDRIGFGVLLVAPAIGLAATAAFIGATVVSPFARLGLAEQVEPDRGIYVDWPLVTLGTVGLALSAFAIAALLFATGSDDAYRPLTRSHGPTLTRQVALTLGVRDALGIRGRGAVITAGCLMSTVVMGLIVGASLDRLPTRPNLWGGGSDAIIDFGERESGEASLDYEQALDTLASDSRMSALTGVATFEPAVGGRETVAFVVDARRGEPIITVVDGRSARTADEIVMGREPMNRQGLHLGDDVALTVGGQTETFHIVGQAVFPIGDIAAFDDSMAVTRAGGDRFEGINSGVGINQILITWAGDVDQTQTRSDLESSGYRVLDRPRLPPAVTNLIQVEQVPRLLALFFGALGLAFFGYMLSASSRSRGRQFAVLATLGMRPRQLASTLRWQAITIVAVAILIGLPAGIIIGRVVWTTIADEAGVAISYATPNAVLAAASLLALLSAIVIAIVLASRLRRHGLVDLLRAD